MFLFFHVLFFYFTIRFIFCRTTHILNQHVSHKNTLYFENKVNMVHDKSSHYLYISLENLNITFDLFFSFVFFFAPRFFFPKHKNEKLVFITLTCHFYFSDFVFTFPFFYNNKRKLILSGKNKNTPLWFPGVNKLSSNLYLTYCNILQSSRN